MGGRHQPQGWKIAYHPWSPSGQHGPGIPRISAYKPGTDERLTDDQAWQLLEDHVQRMYFDFDDSDECAACQRFHSIEVREGKKYVNPGMFGLLAWDLYSILARNEEQAPYPEEKTPGSTDLYQQRMTSYRTAWLARKEA